MKYASMPSVALPDRTWPDRPITTAPVWCAVDLRDGNQALPNPMTPTQKREYFQLLCAMGFKQIEVGFPAASQDDFQFCRDLIEQNMIPDDVVISVLTQARPALISRTMEALVGVKKGIVHFYIATSHLHTKFVFNQTLDQVRETAVRSTAQIRAAGRAMDSQIGLEFSPEEFTDTDRDFAIEICDAVTEVWGPDEGETVVLNLPATVERRLPNEYADLIERFCRLRKYPDHTSISLHVHNDMGCGVAATMLGLKAGAHRVEGTLFGHGERTGNVDLVTIVLNLEYMGVDTGIDISQVSEIAERVASLTDMPLHARHPYAGELVFTAFSGSHQDAIHKGLTKRDALSDHFDGWKVPYLHVDPAAMGRKFEKYIRINSQSGKGGIAHVLEVDYSITLPRWLQVDLAGHVQKFADETSRELTSAEVWDVFQQSYVNREGRLQLANYWPRPDDADPKQINGEAHVTFDGVAHTLRETGNGPISAFVHALRQLPGLPTFKLDEYEEETLGASADAKAACFIRVICEDSGKTAVGVGVGVDSNIDQAAVRGVVSALNALLA
ncbi:MAG TPA: 2-isopropylmalate synthase [Lentisphaeria bacterium]|nr:2-isopropylmalate synthase [Lentisphaeria bacterium]